APYMAWSGVLSFVALMNFLAWLDTHRPHGPRDIVMLVLAVIAPILPIVGFHVHQGLRQFRAGHTLADLRAALDIQRREREEAEALAREEREPPYHRALRIATVGSATWLG